MAQFLVRNTRWKPYALDGIMNVADKDGWIEWGGGDCPIRQGEVVKVKYRNGDYGVRDFFNKQSYWDIFDDGCDIVAYRVIASPAPSPYATIMRGFAAQHSCAVGCILVNEMKGEIL
jgi:hypothetical protein